MAEVLQYLPTAVLVALVVLSALAARKLLRHNPEELRRQTREHWRQHLEETKPRR